MSGEIGWAQTDDKFEKRLILIFSHELYSLVDMLISSVLRAFAT